MRLILSADVDGSFGSLSRRSPPCDTQSHARARCSNARATNNLQMMVQTHLFERSPVEEMRVLPAVRVPRPAGLYFGLKRTLQSRSSIPVKVSGSGGNFREHLMRRILLFQVRIDSQLRLRLEESNEEGKAAID